MTNQTKKNQLLDRQVAEEIAIASTTRKYIINANGNLDRWDMNIRSYIIFIAGVEAYKHFWIRDIRFWEMPNSNDSKSLIKSLANHLFVKYEMPQVLYNAWWNDVIDHKLWFIHVGQGNNLRTAKGLPIVLSKKMVHLLAEVSEELSINAGLRWVQLKSLGADDEIIKKIMQTRLAKHLDNDDFWITVIQFFIKNPHLSIFYIKSIVDYIFDQRFRLRRNFDEKCRWIKLPPHQPHFKMKGRSAVGMKKIIQKWYQKKRTIKKSIVWNAQDIEGLNFETGEGIKYRSYTIRQITDEARLRKEGSRMKHCVYTYLDKCKKGITSIWSMEEISPFGNHRLTIEVYEGKWVEQIRGRFNQWPTYDQIEFIRFWAACEGLTMSSVFDYD